MAEELAVRYLAGELTEKDRAAYEQHFFDCPRCFDELRSVEAARAVLAESRSDLSTTWSRSRYLSPAMLAIAATVLLALSVGLWLRRPASPGPLLVRTGPERPGTTGAGPDIARQTGTAPAAKVGPPVEQAKEDARLVALALVQPPPYVPSRLRGPAGPAQQSIERGMALYSGGRFLDAIPHLRTAADGNPDSPAAAFYLGACYVLTNQPGRALAPFDTVIAAGDTPFLEDAQFYKAKALIAMHDVPGAEAALGTVVSLSGDREQEARKLIGALRALRAGTP